MKLHPTPLFLRPLTQLLLCASLGLAAALPPRPALAQSRDTAAAAPPADKAGFSIGLSAEPLSSPESLGLPTYPGARLAPENEPDRTRSSERGQGTRSGNDLSGSGSLSLWGGSFGVQLRTVRLLSGDSVAAVSDFYRGALARHGTVLDCTAAAAESRQPPPSDKQALRCGDDRPVPGGAVLKVGRRSDMRLVSIKPTEQGTQIQLLHLVLRGD